MGIGSQEGGVMGSDPIVLLSTDSIDITILQKLDKLEDYDPQRQPVENDYTRELVITYPLNGNSRILAWAYFMTPDRIQQLGGVLLPQGWW